MTRLGIIQPARLGDVLICLPIARWHARQGCEVYWPMDTRLLTQISASLPTEGIRYLPVEGPPERWQANAAAALKDANCERIIDLSFGLDGDLGSPSYRAFLDSGQHFDAYKYQLAGVPLEEKWNFPLRRDTEAEARVLASLNLTRPHLALHLQGSSFHVTADLPASWRRHYAIVELAPGLCDNPIHLLGVLEKADKLILVDSFFANLAEQAGLTQRRYFIERTRTRALSPTLREGWERVPPTKPTPLRKICRVCSRSFSNKPVFWGFRLPL